MHLVQHVVVVRFGWAFENVSVNLDVYILVFTGNQA